MKFDPKDIQAAVAGELAQDEHSWLLSDGMVDNTSQSACEDVNSHLGRLLSSGVRKK